MPPRCKWFVSTPHWPNTAPSPPLSCVCSFLTLSINAPPPSPLSSPLHFFFASAPSRTHNLPLCPLLVTVSIFLTCCLSAPLGPVAPALTRPDEWVILLHCTQPSLSVFDNGSFDSFLPVFGGWRRLRAGSRAVIIKSMSTAKPQSLQVIKTLQLRVTSSQSLVFSCPTFWL